MELLQRLRAVNGQSLIEALVALSAASIIVSAIAIAVISSVNNSDYSKNQNKATAYAQAEIEILGQLSKANWQTFNTYSGTYCVGNKQVMASQIIDCSTPNLESTFIRQIDVAKNNSSCASGAGSTQGTSVKVTVSWADGKCTIHNGLRDYCHSANVQSCFTDINTLPTPN